MQHKIAHPEVATGMETGYVRCAKKCHCNWELLNMPFGSPFPEAAVGNKLSAYFCFGSQGRALSTA